MKLNCGLKSLSTYQTDDLACPLGSGALADSAGQTRKHITDCQIPMWSPFVPGGEAIDWAAVDKALDWLRPLRWMPEWRWAARLHHQDLRPGEGLRAVQLLLRSGGLHQIRLAGRVREGG